MLRVVTLAEEEIPKAELASLDLEVGNNGDDGLPPLLISGELGMRNAQSGNNFLL